MPQYKEGNISKQDHIYLEILQNELERTKSRWTVVTFFLSVSFAVLGFSFQQNLTPTSSTPLRIVGVLIYWFTFMVFVNMHNVNMGFWAYLESLEKEKQTTIRLISYVNEYRRQRRSITTTPLMLVFGMFYTLGVGIFWMLGI